MVCALGGADGGADGDVAEGFAVEAEAADGAGVEAAGMGFEFGDDFGGDPYA